MGGVLESRCVGRVNGADGAMRVAAALKNIAHLKNSVQKTTCCNSTSNAPNDGLMYPKYVELRIYQ